MEKTQAPQILITHGPGEGTLLYGTSKGDGIAAVIQPLGWRWSGRIACWYLPRSRDKAPNRATIDRTVAALGTAGHLADVEIDDTRRPTAEIEADRLVHESQRAAALADRAERAATTANAAHAAAREISARMPLGQPILAGHHSQRSMERAYEKIGRSWDKAFEAGAAAETAARRAETASHASGARYNPITVANRIRALEADLRRTERQLNGHTRTLYTDAAGQRAVERTNAATGEWREQLLQRQAELTDQLSYWSRVRDEQVEAGAALNLSASTVCKGDFVHVRSTWYEVVRVNPKSVTVPAALGGWTGTETIRYEKITGHRPATTG